MKTIKNHIHKKLTKEEIDNKYDCLDEARRVFDELSDYIGEYLGKANWGDDLDRAFGTINTFIEDEFEKIAEFLE